MVIDVHTHAPRFRDEVPETHREVNAAWRPNAARPTAVTHHRVATPWETMEGLRRVNDIVKRSPMPRVPEDQIEAIIHRDSLALLGLE